MITEKQPRIHPHINLRIGKTLDDDIKRPSKSDINILNNNDMYHVEFHTSLGCNNLIMRGYEIKDRIVNPALFFGFWNDRSYMTVNVVQDWRKN